MRILHAYKVYLPDIHGGIPHVIATLANLTSRGFDVAVLVARYFGLGRTYRVDGVFVNAVTSFGNLFSMPMALTYPFVFARRARAVDIVVHHAPFPLTDIGILLAFPKRVALIVHWHAEIVGRPFLSKLLAPLMRRTLSRADKIVVSDQAMIEGSNFLKPYARKCAVVPYGCEVDYWSHLNVDDSMSVERLTLRYPRLVLAVGRLVGYKGYEVFLRALQHVDAQAVIIGKGPLKAELENLASELAVSDKVTFIGDLRRDEIKQYIHAAKVFAFPSVTEAEAFGIVQLEAMCAGLPIVNTSLSTGVPHVARNEREGLTVPPREPVALAHALGRLLDRPDLARKLGVAGYARVRAEYDQSLFLDRMNTLYRTVFAQRRTTNE
jgi:rhamnosyl/mannosyltransferase